MKDPLSRSRFLSPLVATSLLVALPLRVQAHTTVEGLDEFSNGLLHPFYTPAHILILLAFGCWTSRSRPFDPRWPLLAFAGGALAGLALAESRVIAGVPLTLLLALAVAAAAVIASGKTAPHAVRLVLTTAAGLLLGTDSAPEDAGWHIAAIKTALGTWVGLNLGFLGVAYYTSLLPERKWAGYAVRIVASWIIAIAAMVLALSLRKA